VIALFSGCANGRESQKIRLRNCFVEATMWLLVCPFLSSGSHALNRPVKKIWFPREKVRLVQIAIGACLLSTPLGAPAATELDFWHSYTHQPSGITHYSFHIANYKRGLFFGSCGPSTRSLLWSYDVDLAGTGPSYRTNQIALTIDGKSFPVLSGTIAIDLKQEKVIIDLQVERNGSAAPFVANGVHRINKSKSA